MNRLRFGPQTCGSFDESVAREWLVSDGLGGFAMGTIAGLRTRRYHGLLVVATNPPGGRMLGLASLDPVLVIGDRRIALATHEWADGTIAPRGHELLTSFEVDRGVPRWRWSIGPVVLEAELAMAHGRSAVGMRYRMISSGSSEPVRLEIEALCTWRDVHGERHEWGEPEVSNTADGFVFEDSYRVRGPGFEPGGTWFRAVRAREEAARGLNATEDLWFAGRFASLLSAGDTMQIEAWSGDLAGPASLASYMIVGAKDRFDVLAARASATDDVDALLAHAADQFIVRPGRPTVVAGYPWFGDWSRDTMTSYEGLFIETGRQDEGRALLLAAGDSVSEGMLANTADTGATEYNTVDACLWFLHAIGRHVERTGDHDLGAMLLPVMRLIVDHHVIGTRFGIRVDIDGLVTQGEDGWALTWMDARVDGRAITPRIGKPVEVNALWLRGLRVLLDVSGRSASTAGGVSDTHVKSLLARAQQSFAERFVRTDGHGLFDIVDGPDGDDIALRPNQLLALSLPGSVLPDPVSVLRAVEGLVTPLGLRSLDQASTSYRGLHRGNVVARDEAYHEGTVWPWLVGPYVDALRAIGRPTGFVCDALVDHLGDWGIGSVSETLDGDAPHRATGCPFQAWSVAELFRARRAASAVNGAVSAGS